MSLILAQEVTGLIDRVRQILLNELWDLRCLQQRMEAIVIDARELGRNSESQMCEAALAMLNRHIEELEREL